MKTSLSLKLTITSLHATFNYIIIVSYVVAKNKARKPLKHARNPRVYLNHEENPFRERFNGAFPYACLVSTRARKFASVLTHTNV
jgi:hypothetical protein